MGTTNRDKSNAKGLQERNKVGTGFLLVLSGSLLSLTILALPALYHWAHKIKSQELPPASSFERSSVATATLENRASLRELCTRVPISFEPNCGQTDRKVKFISRGTGNAIFLTATEAVLELGSREIICFPNEAHSMDSGIRSPLSTVLRVKLDGANQSAQVMGLNELPGKSNYFVGNSKNWRTDVPTYSKVRFKSIYPGIDLLYYGNQRQLEYDFIVAPGADSSAIRLAFEGIENIRLDDAGDLLLETSSGMIRQQRPAVYQPKGRSRQVIAGRYVITGKNQVAFELGPHDRSEEIVIDPVLSYSSYLGGSGQDVCNAIAADSGGNAYIAGRTRSADFPITSGAFQLPGTAFIAKLDRAGSLIYSTYFGGNGFDERRGIAVDSAANVYITGFTGSTNFPATAGAFQTAKQGGSTAFVTKLSQAGNVLVYSTYLGGSDSLQFRGGGQSFGNAIAVDSLGNCYVTGRTDTLNFPTHNALQNAYKGGFCGSGDAIFPCSTAFVTKLNATGTDAIYSTYLGGSRGDEGRGIAADSEGNAYVTGFTGSADFPTVNPIQSALRGSTNAFVAKLTSSGDALVYSTYLGGVGVDLGNAIALDSSGNAYVTGSTTSADFPAVNPFQRVKGSCPPPATFVAGCNDAFVAKFNPAGSSLLYSTYLGGGNWDSGNGIAVDFAGNAYVTGFTFSDDFPTRNALQPFKRADSLVSDAFITKLNSSGSGLFYSTYLGGKENDSGSAIAVDLFGNAYVAGSTSSTNFPTLNPFQANYGGGASDAFVIKIAAPRIIGASTTGKNLLVTGEGFDNGAVIIINGEDQRTRNDDQQMTTLLIGKKAAKKIAPGQTVTLQVRSADGTLSREFSFTRPVE